MRDELTTLDERFPLPSLELWTLLKTYPLPVSADGVPGPGAEKILSAHTAVYEWLAQVELELGCPSFANSADWAEFDRARRKFGLCPKCRRNDGYLMIDYEVYWAMCHTHRVRWQLYPYVIDDGFRPDGSGEWKDPFRPVWKYAVVTPVAGYASDAEPVQLPVIAATPAEKPATAPRLVRADSQPENEDGESWPPPGGASVTERAVRLVGWVYLVLVVVPKTLMAETLERFVPRNWVQNGGDVGPRDTPPL